MIIKLSRTGAEFEHLGNSSNQFPEYNTFVIPADEEFSFVEDAWTGNELIQILDGEFIVSNFRNNTLVRSLTKDNHYYCGIDDEGHEIFRTAYLVSVEKPDLSESVTKNTEDITIIEVALAEIYEELLG